MSRVISHIKLMNGLQAVTLPFIDEITGKPKPTETIIKEIITTATIPVYSQFVPWRREYTVNLSSLECIDKKNYIYKLPAFLTMTPIMYVIDVELPVRNERGTYGDIAPAYGINRSVTGVATSQAYMMVAGEMRSEPSFDYLGEGKIKLYGYPKCHLNFIVACEHMENGESIEDSCYDSFLELANLDVKIAMYNNLKLLDGIPTAFGNIQLKTEDLQSAESERKEWLEKARDSFHLDQGLESFM